VDTAGFGFLHEGFVVTREVRAAKTLGEFAFGGGDIRNILQGNVAGTLRGLHDCGVCHPDLNVSNLLIMDGGQILIVDLDGCRVVSNMGLQRRLRDLLRFRRSAVKRGLVAGDGIWKSFFETYGRGDKAILDETGAWLRGFKMRLPFYKLAWRLGI
jgi:serine/threonine protein kinase